MGFTAFLSVFISQIRVICVLLAMIMKFVRMSLLLAKSTYEKAY
jgi:hypothetical protein